MTGDTTILRPESPLNQKAMTAEEDTTSESGWYKSKEIYDFLIRENYSTQIAEELSKKWSDDLNGARRKAIESKDREIAELKRISLQTCEEFKKQIDSKSAEVAELNTKITALKSIIFNEKAKDKKFVAAMLEEVEKGKALLNELVSDHNKEVDELKSEIERLKGEIELEAIQKYKSKILTK